MDIYTSRRSTVSANNSALLSTTILVALDGTLRKLEAARMDACNRIVCLPGTRVDILQSIDHWQSNIEAEQRTLATTIASLFSERGWSFSMLGSHVKISSSAQGGIYVAVTVTAIATEKRERCVSLLTVFDFLTVLTSPPAGLLEAYLRT